MNPMGAGNQTGSPAGYASGLSVIAIWSGFIVFSRLGVTGNLTAFDMTALRFMVGGLITLPFVAGHWPRQLSIPKILFLAAVGPGAGYSVLMFIGLDAAPAAYAGVFANGTLPIFTALIGLVWIGERLGTLATLGIAVIFAGGVAVGYNGLIAGGFDALAGVAFFLTASATLAVYVVLVRRWQVTPKQTLCAINIPTALIFIPVWWFFLPTNLAGATSQEIAFQALFQGFGPSFLAVLLMTYAVHEIGPTKMAAFAATVPTTAALLAIPVLGEHLGTVEWTGVIVVTAGLLLLLWKR